MTSSYEKLKEITLPTFQTPDTEKLLAKYYLLKGLAEPSQNPLLHVMRCHFECYLILQKTT